jgi:hypothetical protein
VFAVAKKSSLEEERMYSQRRRDIHSQTRRDLFASENVSIRGCGGSDGMYPHTSRNPFANEKGCIRNGRQLLANDKGSIQ